MGIDFQRCCDLGREIVLAIFHVGNRAAQRQHVEIHRIDGFRFGQLPLRRFAVALVELELRHQHIRGHRFRIERQGLLHRLSRSRRVFVHQHLRNAEHCGNPVLVGLERILKRLHGFAVLVPLEKKLAPARVNRRIARIALRGDAIRVVRQRELANCARRTSEARVFSRRRAWPDRQIRNRIEQCAGLGAAAKHLIEKAEFERGLAIRRFRDDRLQQALGFGVLPAIGRSAGLHDRRVARALRVGDPAGAAVRDRTDSQRHRQQPEDDAVGDRSLGQFHGSSHYKRYTTAGQARFPLLSSSSSLPPPVRLGPRPCSSRVTIDWCDGISNRFEQLLQVTSSSMRMR